MSHTNEGFKKKAENSKNDLYILRPSSEDYILMRKFFPVQSYIGKISGSINFYLPICQLVIDFSDVYRFEVNRALFVYNLSVVIDTNCLIIEKKFPSFYEFLCVN